MDTSFDLVALLRQQNTTRSRKIRPTQFLSVAEGVQKRLHTNIKDRKSIRLSVFDRLRKIAKSPALSVQSPKAPALSDSQQKALHRKQQLDKWKEEKDKKKRETAALKKKPFVAGMSQRQTFGPPPPPHRQIPSTSGRVTRSQSRQQTNTLTKSFAPTNATFNPFIFLDTEVPKLAPLNKKKAIITFEPVLPKNVQKETRPATRATRAKPVANKPVVESKTRNKTKVNTETTKTNHQKSSTLKQQMFQSSTSSETEQPKLRKKTSLHKSVPPQESTSQDSACVSMTSEEHNSQDTASVSFQKTFDSPHNAFGSQDNATVIEVLGTVSMSSQDELSTPRTKVPKSESSSEEKLRSPKPFGGLTPEQIIENAKISSPCVTMSRGKDNARKEMKKKLVEGLMDNVNHFRQQLDSEITRMTAMCETWDQVFAQTVLPEPVQELVLTALGQARLLMSKKLQQFAGLIESCAKPTPGTIPVTPADLHGFWDMVYMQVENVNMRFNYLEELRLRNWIEEQQPIPKRVVAKPAAKKPVVKPTGGPSRIREMIAAARKAKKNQESQSENSDPNKSQPTASPETKTFEAGFFSVSSPVRRTPAPGTPGNKSSLLKCVLSNEANKSVSKISTLFPRLQASMMSSGDIEGVSPLVQTPTVTPVNTYATPARSILKLNSPASTKKTDRAKTVLFQGTDDFCSPVSYTSCEVEAGIAPLPDDDNKENQDTPKKEAAPRRSRLKKQNAVEQSSPSPLRTRSQRKSAQTCIARLEAAAAGPGGSTGQPRSTRKSKVVQLVPETEAPSLVEANAAGPEGSTGKPRSTRKSKVVQLVPETEALSLVEANAADPEGNTGKPRSTRKAKVAQLLEPETEAPRRYSQRRRSPAAE